MTVTIVGAGFSGMTLAWLLQKQGAKVHIIEKSSRTGGMLETKNVDGNLVECAANGLIWSELVEQLFRDVGCPMVSPKASSKKRFIWRKGLRRWPLTFFESLVLALKFFWFKTLKRGDLSPLAGQTIAQWADRFLGAGALRYLVSPGLQGIYAGDTDRLSASLILGRFFDGQKRKYRGTVCAPLGMGQLMGALEKHLRANGVTFELRTTANLENLPRPLVIATSAVDAQKFLGGTKFEMVSLVTVTRIFREVKSKIQGFGFLVPHSFGFKTLGVLSNTYVFDRGPDYHETWILGGAHHPEVAEWSEAEVTALITKERQALLKDDSQPFKDVITFWPQGLPHYTVDLEAQLKKLKPIPGMYVTGNYTGSLGLTQILQKNQHLAKEIL